MKRWREWVHAVLDVIYPPFPVCSLCACPVRNVSDTMIGGDGEPSCICRACEAKFAFIRDHICRVCGRPYPTGETCGDCLRRTERYFMYSRSAVCYNEQMKEVLARYKYRGDRKLVEVMDILLYWAWQRYYAGMNIHCLTYIPLHEKRLIERTFNQAEEMARILGNRLRIPVYGLLERKKATEKQSKKNRTGRLHALENVFSYMEASEVHMPDVPVIVLVDDVYTTGSTLNEAARTLKQKWPEAKIYGLTVAR
jgi:competence protein ComFC